MASRAKKPSVFKESQKIQHTTHWDIDYLPRKEVDALYGRRADAVKAKAPENPRRERVPLSSRFRRLPLWLVLVVLVLLLGRFMITLLFHLLA